MTRLATTLVQLWLAGMGVLIAAICAAVAAESRRMRHALDRELADLLDQTFEPHDDTTPASNPLDAGVAQPPPLGGATGPG